MAKKGWPQKPAAGAKPKAKQAAANKGATIKKSGSRGKAAAGQGGLADPKAKAAKTAAQLAPRKTKTKVKQALAVAVKRRRAMAAAAAAAAAGAGAAAQPLLEAGRTLFCFDTNILIGHPQWAEWAWAALERAGGSSGCLALVPLVSCWSCWGGVLACGLCLALSVLLCEP